MRYKTDDGCVIEDGTLIRVVANSQKVVIPCGVHKIRGRVLGDIRSLKKISTHSNPNENNYTTLEVEPNWKTYFVNIILGKPEEPKEIPYGSDYMLQTMFINSMEENLEEVALPTSLKEIGTFAFLNCTSLHTVTLPDGLEKIHSGAFKNCSSLEEITIPDSVTYIDDFAFFGCVSLKKINLPEKFINSDIFRYCGVLEEINGHRRFSYLDSISVCKDDYFGTLEKEIIPEGTRIIRTATFRNNTSLFNVVMPNSLLTINSEAFSGCTSLQNLILPNNISQIYSYAFYSCTSLENIILPDNLESLGEKAFGYCGNLKEITIPYNVIFIGKDVFYGCKNLRKITLVYKNFKDKKRVQELSKMFEGYFDDYVEIRFESIHKYSERKKILISLINDKLNVQTNMQIIDRENCLPQYEISEAKEDDSSDCNAIYNSEQHTKTTGKKVRRRVRNDHRENKRK